jgi:hypothetical protein
VNQPASQPVSSSVLEGLGEGASVAADMRALQSLGFEEVPRDDQDNRFAHSFALSQMDEAEVFLLEYGFVVLRDVFDEAQCEASVRAMWSVSYKVARIIINSLQ